VEFDPQREQALVVDEVDEPAALLQVAQEAEGTGRVPHRDEVLEEGHLHRRVLDEHAAVPAEAGLPLQEQRVHRRRSGGGVVLVHRDRQRQVRRAEADPDKVEDRSLIPARLWHRSPIVYVETGSTVPAPSPSGPELGKPNLSRSGCHCRAPPVPRMKGRLT
jgi:hypothetical protein